MRAKKISHARFLRDRKNMTLLSLHRPPETSPSMTLPIMKNSNAMRCSRNMREDVTWSLWERSSGRKPRGSYKSNSADTGNTPKSMSQ